MCMNTNFRGFNIGESENVTYQQAKRIEFRWSN